MNLSQLFKAGPFGNIIAILSGAMLTFAFAPFSLFPLAILSPALFLGLLLSLNPKQAFLRGWLFGLGFFGTGVYWVYISIHTYGDASIPLAGFITIVFIAILALFPALNGYLLSRYFPLNDNKKIIYAFPALWVLCEWIRSWIFTGFPWLLLGVSQTNSPLKGFAPVFGVYGVSLAVLITSSVCVSIILKQQKLRWNLLILALIWGDAAYLSTYSWTKNSGNPIQVSLVQGNIDQGVKWSYDQITPTLDHYQALTSPHWDSKIIIWPENAVPLPLPEASDFIEKMNVEAKNHQATLITGIPVKHPEKNAYYNAVIAVGHDLGFYLKQRLVPFGEYTPFPQLLTRLMDKFNIPMSNLTPSESFSPPLNIQGIKIAAFICYEIAYPEQVLQNDSDIDMLLTVSNDAWFGRSIAQAQHLQIAQMRALELARPVLFVSNNGITAIIKSNGVIKNSIKPFETAVLTDSVQPMNGKTPWQRVGMDPVLLLLISFFFYSIRSQRKQRKKAS